MLVMATVSISAKDIKEFVVTTQPQMSCQNCEKKIKNNLRFEKGVTNIQTDLENQVVIVSYDADKTNEANLTKAFGKLDYKVTPTEKPQASANSRTKAKKCDGTCKGDKKCDGKSCDKEKADKKCDGKSCDKDKAGKKCDGKSCDKEKADKKCDGTCKGDKKCDGKCDHHKK